MCGWSGPFGKDRNEPPGGDTIGGERAAQHTDAETLGDQALSDRRIVDDDRGWALKREMPVAVGEHPVGQFPPHPGPVRHQRDMHQVLG
ncbi:hypothetical protein D9M70_545990 [compost metagenome]